MLARRPWQKRRNSCSDRYYVTIGAGVDQLLILGMVIPPLLGNPDSGYIKPQLLG